jgi:sugar/nucleoside kinase (ribokinase family)
VAEGKKLVICTHGKAGATLLSPEEGWIDLPALEVPVVDSNGAGDYFFAGFLAGWMNKESLGRCMEMGNEMGAQCVQSLTPTSRS